MILIAIRGHDERHARRGAMGKEDQAHSSVDPWRRFALSQDDGANS
jgi:hypothetical protein